MAATARLTQYVTSPYEGGSRVWSCTFHFTGSDPTTAEWETLADNVRDAFKLILNDTETITLSRGYNAGSDIAVFERAESTDGTYGITGTEIRAPLQVAALLRWSTAVRTSKNHPVYLFNYVHGPVLAGTADKEALSANWLGYASNFAAAWVTGFSDGSGTRFRAGPNGAQATGHSEHAYVTHRDFPA